MNFNLEEETKCEYLITSERKKLWIIELEILKEFDSVCKKYNLTYFLIAGGMLGAVRHHGFIPWDDDIDIGMFRKDYNKLLEVASKEFKTPYFLQNGINDDEYFDTIVRIRDCRTTGIVKKDLNSKCNNGIFIEILPFDNIPNSKALSKIQNSMISLYKGMLFRRVYSFLHETTGLNSVMAKLAPVFFKIFSPQEAFEKYQKWCSKYENDKSCKYVNILSAYSKRNTFRYERHDLEEMICVEFENVKAHIPKAYDKCLSHTYNDYMKLPPIEKRGMKHNDIVAYNPYIPYVEYLKKLKKGEITNPFENISATVKKEEK